MKKLEVRLQTSPEISLPVGTLVEEKRGVFFEYSPDFLQSGLWLSPFKLPLKSGVFQHRDRDFGPIFGLFDDSLPDGWGLLLMDRFLRGKGVLPSSISALDRLAYLGSRTMGALTYFPPNEPLDSEQSLLDLHRLAKDAKHLLQGEAAVLLPQLFQLGGSPGGARPKILVGVQGDTLISGEDTLPEGYQPWLIKFHGHTDGDESGAIEYAFSQIARMAGIEMPVTRLFETKEGDRFFGIERFDRTENRRFHTHSFGNLIHANFRIPSCDYLQFLEVIHILTKNQKDVEEGYRRMIFNIASNNRDDHVKNFSFLLGEDKRWRLAPAFDLTYAEGPNGEHTMTVQGEGRQPKKKHVLGLADSVSIAKKTAEKILEEVCDATMYWSQIAEDLGIQEKRVLEIAKRIEKNIQCLRKS